MKVELKPIVWHGDSRQRIRDFPEDSKDIAGSELFRVQAGELPADWRPMPEIAKGVIEIRIHRPQEYRILYVASHPGAIHVLHAFQKKTRRTSALDIEIARRRYAEIGKESQEKRRSTRHR